MPAARDILVDGERSTLAFSEPVLSKVSTTPDSCPAEANHLDCTHPGMRENGLPDAVPDTKEMETSRLSCVPCVTAPTPAPEQANNALSNQSAVGNSEQESAKRKLPITGPCSYGSMHPGDCEKDTEPSQTSDLGEDPCPRANDAPEPARVSGTAEDKSGPPGSSPPPTVYSTPECSGARTTPSSDSLARYPSIAVVIPPPSWKRGAIRTSTRAAAAVCKKRLRSARDTDSHQDRNATFYDTERPGQKKKKRRTSTRPLSDPPGSSIPVPCHCSGAIQGVRGSALLTVESNSGLKPAYYFTFVPDPGPMPSRPHTADISGKQKPYTSDENALLVRLKEREAMSWSEITAYFPGRNMSSLQVHYSTQLRHKASSRSGKSRRRE
ncbi:uncharacterized protein LDX57_009351 [Aspergillus melleus]|uniref:uncharacterized protein n=1 Tax=Aspergillus melleus TaxID=138277 RepID=UPI001E8EF279|nr:uncharacterized protein LDX57_009351 [Aspergillus melleus]KAH8431697.1 hypothetical protein LDX57_009351 [Aspergillus melleus]